MFNDRDTGERLVDYWPATGTFLSRWGRAAESLEGGIHRCYTLNVPRAISITAPLTRTVRETSISTVNCDGRLICWPDQCATRAGCVRLRSLLPLELCVTQTLDSPPAVITAQLLGRVIQTFGVRLWSSRLGCWVA